MSYLTDKFDDEVERRLRKGQVGLLPSDTLYGLSCLALNPPAVEQIQRLKGRGPNKPFIVLISDTKMLKQLRISDDQAKIAKVYWPNQLSIIFQSEAPDYLTAGTNSLAVRLPDYPELINIIDKTGPLISTSANLQGQQPAQSADEAKKLFGEQLDFYVDVGRLSNPPSTLAELKDSKLKVIRPGAVKIGT